VSQPWDHILAVHLTSLPLEISLGWEKWQNRIPFTSGTCLVTTSLYYVVKVKNHKPRDRAVERFHITQHTPLTAPNGKGVFTAFRTRALNGIIKARQKATDTWRFEDARGKAACRGNRRLARPSCTVFRARRLTTEPKNTLPRLVYIEQCRVKATAIVPKWGLEPILSCTCTDFWIF